ncbi:MAG: hypothetical protein ACTHLC_09025 [Rhizobiaceae bacterium]|jgi:hypothetical protein
MNDRSEHSRDTAPARVQSVAGEDSTLLPMLIGGLVLIVIGMVFVMWLA